MSSFQERTAACNVRLCSTCSKPQVHFHCTFCKEDICQGCVLNHLISDAKTENGHNVVDFKDKNKNKTHRDPCTIHNKPTTAYCKECNLLVCQKCTEENHKHHKFQMITNRQKDAVNEIQAEMVQLSASFENLKKYYESIQTLIRTFEQDFLTVKHKIGKKAEEFIKIIFKWKDEMLIYAKSKRNERIRIEKSKALTIKDQMKKVKKRKNSLTTSLGDFENLQNPHWLIERAKKIHRPGDIIQKPDTLESESLPHLILLTSNFSANHLCQFAKISVSSESDIIHDSAIHEIKPFAEEIQDMSCDLETSSLLVAESKTKQVVKINSVGKELTRYDTTSEPSSIAACGKGILYATPQSIRSVKPKIFGKGDTCFTQERDWLPRGIAFSKPRVYICQISWPAARGRLLIQNIDTGKKYVIEHDDKGQPLYKDPKYVAVNIKSNGDICVTDHEALIVVEKSGKCRFKYTKHKFNPQNICVDSMGQIHILDILCNLETKIHVLSKDGQFLRSLRSPQFHDITAMTIDCYDCLFIADKENDKTKIKKISLYGAQK